MLIVSRNFKQLVKPIYTTTFCDHTKNMKQILCEYDLVHRPLTMFFIYLNGLQSRECHLLKSGDIHSG